MLEASQHWIATICKVARPIPNPYALRADFSDVEPDDGYQNFENKFWWLEINIGQILTIW